MAKTGHPREWRVEEGLSGVLHTAIEAVPSVKYALGVAGIIAAVALVKGYFSSAAAALLAGAGMVALMVVLLVFAAASRLAARTLQLPALVFTWAIMTLFIMASCLLMLSVFFRWPAPFPELLKQSFSPEVLSALPAPEPSAQPPGSGSQNSHQSNDIALLGTEWVFTTREIDDTTARAEKGWLKIYAASAAQRDVLRGPGESPAKTASGSATECNQAAHRQCGLAAITFDGNTWNACRYSAEKSEALIECPSDDVLPTNKLRLQMTAELVKGTWTIYCWTGDGIQLWRPCPSTGVLLFDVELSRPL
jgi:hypothetical protein